MKEAAPAPSHATPPRGDTATHRIDQPYLVVECGEHTFGIPHAGVRTVLDFTSSHRVPGMSGAVAGVIDHEGSPVPVHDVRRRCGLVTHDEEVEALIATLGQRRQDHFGWLASLKAQVDAGGPIRVQTDPHKCAFGRWYDQRSFASTTLTEYMNRFDRPHQAIHAVATQADASLARGRGDEARALIREAESGVFQGLVGLFDGAAAMIRAHTYQYAVLCVRADGSLVGLLVDRVDHFGLFDELIEPLPRGLGATTDSFVTALGRVGAPGDRRDVLLLDVDRLVNEGPMDPGSAR